MWLWLAFNDDDAFSKHLWHVENSRRSVWLSIDVLVRRLPATNVLAVTADDSAPLPAILTAWRCKIQSIDKIKLLCVPASIGSKDNTQPHALRHLILSVIGGSNCHKMGAHYILKRLSFFRRKHKDWWPHYSEVIVILHVLLFSGR